MGVEWCKLNIITALESYNNEFVQNNNTVQNKFAYIYKHVVLDKAKIRIKELFVNKEC